MSDQETLIHLANHGLVFYVSCLPKISFLLILHRLAVGKSCHLHHMELVDFPLSVAVFKGQL